MPAHMLKTSSLISSLWKKNRKIQDGRERQKQGTEHTENSGYSSDEYLKGHSSAGDYGHGKQKVQ